jgi:hypothetical protein
MVTWSFFNERLEMAAGILASRVQIYPQLEIASIVIAERKASGPVERD